MKDTIAEDEFGVDVGDMDLLKRVVLKQMEEDCAGADKGLDIGGALVDVSRKACLNLIHQLPLSTGPLEEGFGHVSMVRAR